MKMFTLRKIPEELHLVWKITAAKQGISMEDLAIKILEAGLLESEESEEKKVPIGGNENAKNHFETDAPNKSGRNRRQAPAQKDAERTRL